MDCHGCVACQALVNVHFFRGEEMFFFRKKRDVAQHCVAADQRQAEIGHQSELAKKVRITSVGVVPCIFDINRRFGVAHIPCRAKTILGNPSLPFLFVQMPQRLGVQGAGGHVQHPDGGNGGAGQYGIQLVEEDLQNSRKIQRRHGGDGGFVNQAQMIEVQAKLFFRKFSLGNVDRGADDCHLAAVLDRRPAVFQPTLRSVLADDLQFITRRNLDAALARLSALPNHRLVVQMNDLPEIHFEKLFAVVSGECLGGGVDEPIPIAGKNERSGRGLVN